MKNKKLQKANTEVLADNNRIILSKAKASDEKAQEAEVRAEKEKELRINAEKKINNAQYTVAYIKIRYKTLLIGHLVFFVLISIFEIIKNNAIFTELLDWFVARWINLEKFTYWACDMFVASVSLLNTWWKIPIFWNYIIVSIVYLAVIVGLFYLLRFIVDKLEDLYIEIREKSIFQRVLLADVIIGSLFGCIFFFAPMKTVIPLNVFSLWLIFSFISCIACNFLYFDDLNDK